MSTWWNAVKKSVQAIAADTPSRKNEITDRLTQFRISAEAEAETSVIHIETNLALALDDVCQALGLYQENVYQILGAKAYAYAYTSPAIKLPDEWAEEYTKRAASQKRLRAQLNQVSRRQGTGYTLTEPAP